MRRALLWTLSVVTAASFACAPTPAPVAAPNPAAAERATPPPPVDARGPRDEDVKPALAPLPRDHFLPTADGVVVFEVARMRRRFDIGALARAFVLSLVEIDLRDIEKTCGLRVTEAVHRLVLSGSLENQRLLAAFDLEVPPSRLMDCLAKVFPEAKAQEILGHPVLELGHQQLWITERGGVLLLAERPSLVEALGGEPEEPSPPMIDGIPLAERSLGNVDDALPLLSRDPHRLIAVGHRGRSSGGFLRLPTLSITFAFDDAAFAVEGDIDLSAEPRPENVDRLRRNLRREIAREMEHVAGDPSEAAPLLRAVDEALIDQRDGHLVFSGSTTALDVLQRLVAGVAEREIARELERDAEPTPDAAVEEVPARAVPAEPADVSRDR